MSSFCKIKSYVVKFQKTGQNTFLTSFLFFIDSCFHGNDNTGRFFFGVEILSVVSLPQNDTSSLRQSFS
ncbi:MAG: hypothetical protein EDM72_04250 [Chlorobiota bacterium]|nr:MAG: hypothetical protein EDM72_04250 [Chlorobiota bacterium]